MKPLLILGGRLIDPNRGIDETGNLLITEGKISAQGKEEITALPSDCEVLSAEGLIVCPGFIDLHCHLREPGFTEKETIATGTRAAAQGGFTTICCMPNTNPPLDNIETIKYVKSKANQEGVVRVLPIGCISRGQKGGDLAPLSELASAGVIGFSDDGEPVSNSPLMRRALESSRKLELPIIDHCEDKSLAAGGVMNEGTVSTKVGLPGIPASAEESMVARDLQLAGATGGWLHVAHVSTAGSVELIRRAKEKGIHVTAEVTPHHLTLTEAMVQICGSNAKVNPPLRTSADTQALLQGLMEGTIDVIATDHAPHTRANKQGDFITAAFGISGLETALAALLTLVHEGKLDLVTLVSRLTAAPARIIGNKHGRLGTLAVGAPADVTIFDPNKEWIVDPDNFVSKGKNTPWGGFALKGKVMATIYQGKMVYKDNSIRIAEWDKVIK